MKNDAIKIPVILRKDYSQRDLFMSTEQRMRYDMIDDAAHDVKMQIFFHGLEVRKELRKRFNFTMRSFGQSHRRWREKHG